MGGVLAEGGGILRAVTDGKSRMNQEIVFVDGAFVAAARATISVYDRGFQFADAVFETIRAYRGEPFALVEHLARLRLGARTLGFAAPNRDAWWRRAIRELLRRNALLERDAAVRITLTRGADGRTLLPGGRTRPTIVMTLRPLDPRLARLRRTGAAVVTVPFHPGIGGLLGATKTTDYATAVVAKDAARRRRAFEAVYLLPGDRIGEGTTSNVFAVRRGRILTPPAGGGILPGVTRARVIALARGAGITLFERSLTRAELLEADEVFLTATTIEVMPVRTIDGRRVGGGAGPVTRRLQDLYCAAHPGRRCE